MSTDGPSVSDLARRLSEAEATVQALLRGQIDAVVDTASSSPVLLSKAQGALRESEFRYRRIVETTSEGVWIIDAANRTAFMNRRMAEILGCGNDACAGRPVADFLNGDELAAFRALLDAAEAHEVGIVFTRPDGTAVHTVVEASSTLDEDGRRSASLAMVRDVTERFRAAAALQASMEEFRALAEAMPQIVWITRADGWCTYFNPRWMEYTGLKLEDSLGHAWAELVHPADRERAWRAWQTATSSKTTYSVEYRLRSADGTYRWWLSRGEPVRDGAGAVQKWFGTCTDIHGLKTAELEISRTNRALKMLSACNEALFRAGSQKELLDTLCRIAVETGGYRAAWVSLAQEAGVLPHGLHAHAGAAETEISEILADFARTGSYSGLIRLPLAEGSRVLGHLALLSADIRPTSDEELGLLKDMAGGVAFGIASLRAQSLLREGRSFLEQAQAVGHMGSWVFDPESQRVAMSAEASRIVGSGKGASEGPAEAILALIHPADVDAVRAALEAALTGGPHYSIDYRTIPPDGPARVVHAEGQLIPGDAGRPLKMVGVVQDITESTAAKERLRASEERYRILFDESPVPMWAYDPESLEIVMANHAAALQYGYTTDELVTMTLPDIRPLDVDGESIRVVNRGLPPGRKQTGLWQHRRKDGVILDVDVHLNEVQLDGRQLRLAVLHDVTQRRNLEEQLRQSQKMEAVGRLAGGVAHDFNNLLTVILGYGDLLASRYRPGDPERAEVQEIRRAGERAAALTQQLLAFSRKQVLVPVPLDLGAVVDGVFKMLGRLIGEHIVLSLNVKPDLGRILADPGQMEQVVMNLAVNARDAMPRGGELLIEVENVNVDAAFERGHIGASLGPSVRLTVRDTGVGMPPEILKQVFEPFFTTKPVGEGTGLGLATVFGIVNQSGGTIWVESQVGRGTAFTIYFPCVAGAAPRESSRSGSRLAVAGGHGTILLVEDEQQLALLAKRVLEVQGYTVIAGGTPAQALERARAHPGPIDLLLTDVVMPGMSGPELAAKLLLERPGLPVLFMSGYTDDAMIHHGIVGGGTQFIQKPFTTRALAQRVQEILRGVPPGEASRAPAGDSR